MGKGLSQRRRQKNAALANVGNLHKALVGKTGGAKFLPLPDAPKAEELNDKLPKSLRKIMMMKAADERQKKKRQGKNLVRAEGPSQETAKEVLSKKKKSSSIWKSDPESEEEEAEVRRPSGLDTGGLNKVTPEALVKKIKKRDYLAHKKKKKLDKVSKDDPTLLEQSLKDQGKVRFGDRSDAPIEFNLKRKHWSTQQDKTVSERCKGIFLKQMEEAKQKDNSTSRGVPMPSGGSSGSTKLPQKNTSKKPLPDLEHEELRLQVIEAYRAQKRAVSVNGATMSSLAKLVKRGSNTASQALS